MTTTSQFRAGLRGSIALVLVLTLGCDADERPAHDPMVIAYTHSGVPWVFDSEGYQYLVDTGTPRSFVVPTLAELPDDNFSVQRIPGWHVQGLGVDAEVVVTWELPPPVLAMLSPSFGGVLGADVLARQPFMLDPYRGRLILDDDGDFGEWLSETDQVAHVPVEVVGGGTSCMSAGRCFSHEGRRMLVEVILEGEPTLALLDTGSTYTTMGLGLFERLEAKRSRPRVAVSRGWDTWEFARVEHLTIGEIETSDLPIRVKPELDTALARLRVETNRPVELLLGHSLLLYFAAGFDYDHQTLTLARYTQPQRVETEMFEGFGIWLADTAAPLGCFWISAVALDQALSAAGLEVGDCVSAIAGHEATTLGLVNAERLMGLAAIGETLDFLVIDDVLRDPSSSLNHEAPARTLTLTKRDLLPRF